MTEADYRAFSLGALTLTGIGFVLAVVSRILTFRWLRPGTLVAAFFWKLAQYTTALARAVDMFVVEYRQSKKDLEEETLRCAEGLNEYR